MTRYLHSTVLLAALAGVAAFALALFGLSALVARQTAASTAPVAEAAPAGGAAARRLALGHVGVGLGVGVDQSLLFQAATGDQLDVLAVVPGAADQPGVAAVVVSGARVLQPPSSATSVLLLEVEPADAQVLAHLIGRGVALSYALWSDRGKPQTARPIDARAALASLGLAATPTPPTPPTAVVTATEAPTPPPTPTLVATLAPIIPTATPAPVAEALPAPTPEGTPRPSVYTVRRGDTLANIATRFDVDYTALVWANRRLPNRNALLPGTEIFLPDYRGTLYVVRPGDTWDSLGRSLGYTAETLKEINDLPAAATLEAGMQLFLPSGLYPTPNF